MSNVNKNNNKGGVCQCQEMNKISDVCLFLVLDANHRGHLQKKKGSAVYMCITRCVQVCVCQTERDAYVWNTLSSAPDDPKTALEGGQEKVEKSRKQRDRDRHAAWHRERLV